MILSIVLPVYNTEMYIRRCIQSILNQDLKSFEVIVINDGSTDNSLEIIKELVGEDNRFKVITTSNQGQANARKMGIDISKGQYIGFLDSDDFISPNYFSRHLDNIVKEEADISILGYKLYYSSNQSINMSNEKIYESYTGDELKYQWISSVQFKGFLWDKVFKRELFNNVIYQTDFNFMEDVAIGNYLFFNAQKIIYDGTPLYYYVQRTDNSVAQEYQKNDIKALECVSFMKNYVTNDKLKTAVEDRYALVALSLMARIRVSNRYENVALDIQRQCKKVKFDFFKSKLPFIYKLLFFLLIKGKYTKNVDTLKDSLIKFKQTIKQYVN